MSVWKKIVAGVVVTALVAGAGAGGLNYMRKSRIKEVLVIPVEDLQQEYYYDDTTLDGNITTNVSQNISMDKDMVVEELYVSQGDIVSVGDPLVSFDMTLVNMELEIAKLKQEKLEIDLQKAEKRLTSLKNGGPITEDTDGLDADNLGSDEAASSVVSDTGIQLAAAFRQMLLIADASGTEDFGGGDTSGNGSGTSGGDISGNTPHIGNEENNGNQQNSENQENIGGGDTSGSAQEPTAEENGSNPQENTGSGENSQTENQTDNQTVAPAAPDYDTPTAADGSDFNVDDDFSLDDSDFLYTNFTFYRILDDKSEPYAGSGTEDDPFIYLCSSGTGAVIAMGTFLNKMAGFSADGVEELHPGGYWYLLEFHTNDTIEDTRHREDSCTGYYLINGGILEEPTSMFAEVEYTLADALHYQEDIEPEEPDPGVDVPGSDSTISRQDAIRAQETRVRTIQLDIEEGLINIRKLEKKSQNQLVTSRLEGTVASVGDPITGAASSSGAFVTVKSKEGFFVKGSASELMLDEVQPGTKLKCTSYDVGDFDAEVVDVSDYPSSNSDGFYFYGGDSNPNVSYYTFSATIEDQTLNLTDGDWIQIRLQTDASRSNKLVLSKAFVRSENGMNYVYKSEDGKLKKQYITVDSIVDSGYSVIIKGGLKRSDMISFPYGDGANEGAPTKPGTENDLYDQ